MGVGCEGKSFFFGTDPSSHAAPLFLSSQNKLQAVPSPAKGHQPPPISNMLTRKQQWRRARVRRAPRGFGGVAAVADGTNKPGLDERRERDRESTTSTSSTISSWSSSSFDSLHDDDDGDDDGNGGCDDLSPPQANRSTKHTVSFQEEVQVFLVKHKSEIDTR